MPTLGGGGGKGEAITGASGASASISVIFLSVFCFFPREWTTPGPDIGLLLRPSRFSLRLWEFALGSMRRRDVSGATLSNKSRGSAAALRLTNSCWGASSSPPISLFADQLGTSLISSDYRRCDFPTAGHRSLINRLTNKRKNDKWRRRRRRKPASTFSKKKTKKNLGRRHPLCCVRAFDEINSFTSSSPLIHW